MRDLEYRVTIPKNTQLSNPYYQTLTLVKGTLTKVWIGFPSGCRRMVNIQILIGDRVILPIDVDMFYAYDDYQFERQCEVTLDQEPYEIRVKGYSPNTRYDHTISFVFQIDDNFDIKTRIMRFLAG